MKIEANIPQTTSSPQLTPRAAQAVAVAKVTAERLSLDTGAPMPDMQKKLDRVTLPDTLGARVDLRVDKETGRVIGTVVDRNTGKVLRQIPSESMVALIRATREQLGPLVDVNI